MLSYLSHGETISPNSPHSFDLIIRYSKVVPPPHLDLTTPHSNHSLTRPRGKSNKPFPFPGSPNDPQVYSAPCPWLVVKNGSRASRLYPNCDGYFVHRVQFTVVWKRNVAVSSSSQLDGTRGKAVWSIDRLDVSEFSSWILKWRDVLSLENAAERIGSYGYWSNCILIQNRIN